MRPITGLAAILIVSTALVTPVRAAEPGVPADLITPMDAIAAGVDHELAEPFDAKGYLASDIRGQLVEYYEARDDKPLWVDADGLTKRASALMAEIRKAGDWGLDASDFKLPSGNAIAASEEDKPAKLARLDVMLSEAALTYAWYASGGRVDPQSVNHGNDPDIKRPSAQAVMDKLETSDDVATTLTGFNPPQPEFAALRKLLLAERGSSNDPQVHVPDGPLLRPGMANRQVPIIRARLDMGAPDGADADVYSDDVVKAVKAFQRSKGILVDGLVGNGTRHAMNGKAPNRVKKILINMERWRWLPRDMGSFYVRVNVPEFLVRVNKNGKVIHTERVVVGKPSKQTPIFSDRIEQVVFNPYWNVPNSIKVEEILPSLRRPSYGYYGERMPRIVTRNNLKIKYNGHLVDPMSVDWSRVDIRRFHIYQPPGGPNVLGNMKFVFPNKHSIYMHDTTSKYLFKKSVRAYSHGCMRVRNPRKLAEVLLANRSHNWSAGRIARAIASGDNTHARLDEPTQVHITYFTAWADMDDGRFHTYRDIYGHDRRLEAALGL